MKSVEETVGNRKIINVVMESDAQSLGEVVVTAMGIQRQSETSGGDCYGYPASIGNIDIFGPDCRR